MAFTMIYLIAGVVAASIVATLWRLFESEAPPIPTLCLIAICWLPLAMLMLAHLFAQRLVSTRMS